MNISQFFPFFNTIITLFILLAVGYIAGKAKIIRGSASKTLSTLIIKIGQPAMIVNSLIKMEYSAQNLGLGLKTLLFGLVAHIFMAAVSYFAFFRFHDLDERKLTEFSAVFVNAGFIGIPILESLFGDRGAFMGAFFVVMFNLVLWTWGIIILARGRDDIKLTPRKLINYGTVPCTVGFLLYLGKGLLPTLSGIICSVAGDSSGAILSAVSFLSKSIMSALGHVASLCTPISTIIIGALLSTLTVKQILGSKKIYYLCAIKLLVIPISISVIMILMGFSSDWVLFAAAVTSMPSATSATMLAEMYDIRPEYSAQAVGTTSLLSVATMPCVMLTVQKLTEIL